MTSAIDVATIGARLATIAHRLPDKIAIVEQEGRITFGELDAQASAIARQLMTVSREGPAVVCLFFESKLPAVKSIFGACRSGHAYVPLDSGDPEERLRFILRDCEPVAVLTEGILLDRARAIAPPGCAVIDIEHVQQSGEAGPFPVVHGDAPAFLYYTSGSTGQPKGVIQTHANLLFFADAYAKALSVVEGDRFSLLYTLSFAAANNGIFRALLHGATLCAYDMRRDGIPQLAGWLDRERITVLHTVTTVLREMANRLPPARVLPHLRAIHLGGEYVFAGDVELFRRHTLEHCILVNQFASTEAGVIAQNIIDHRSPTPASTVISAGRCVDGVRVEIRRADGSIADTDEVGELVVCGQHLSPGYWRRPDLDAAAFSVDPAQRGSRRFQSGDFGRIDEAGNLHFLGRGGSRIKVRGHSVDLMEIEAALSACPDVLQATVVAVGEESRMEPVRLIAYVVARQESARDPLALRRHLATRLPLYMLPAGVAYLDAFPLTATGKVDRKALAQIDPARADSSRTVESPRDDIERTVASVFEQLLKLEPVGRDDDFFLLGGDSLLGVELQTRLMEAFGVHVGNFHADATVARIAANVRRAASLPASTSRRIPMLIPLWRNGSEPPLFLVHGRHGQAFVSPHFMQLLGNDQPVWVFQARGLDGLCEPHASVGEMAGEYLAEMREQRPHGPYFLGALCVGAYVVAMMAQSLREAGEVVLPLLLLDPPNRVRARSPAQGDEALVASKMKARRAMGRIHGPADDPAYLKASILTAAAFDDAIANHRPLPYDGPVYALSSRQRIHGADPLDLGKIFTGMIERHEVGTTHVQALDPRNPVFASTLLRCVGLIREAARTGQGVGQKSFS